MIRTHRPRGSYWTCASTFQQSQDYRQIDFSDEVPASTEVLHEDGDRCSDPSKQSSKRRRLEKLATKFMNGSPLEIFSARKTEAIWSHVTPGVGDSVWADILDDREYLEDYLANGASNSDSSGKVMRQNSEGRGDSSDREIVVARSSNLRSSRVNRSPLMRAPSAQALEVAAQLRDRAIQKRVVHETQPSMPIVHEYDPDHENGSSTTTQESTTHAPSSPTAAWTSARWLRSRPPLPRRKRVDEDCSRDELGMSSAATQSHTHRSSPLPPRLTPNEPSVFSSAKTHISSVEEKRIPAAESDSQTHLRPCAMTSDASALPSLGHQMIKEHHSIDRDVDVDGDRNQYSSETRSGPGSTSHIRRNFESMATGSEAQQPGTVGARNVKDLGRPKSLGIVRDPKLDETVPRRRSAPSGSQQAARQKGRVSATEEASPFLFRKTVKRIADSDGDHEGNEREPGSMQRPQGAQGFADGYGSPPNIHSIRGVSADNFGESSLTPLTDKHLNRLLRSNSESGDSASTLRNQLREELVRSGAVLTTTADASDGALSQKPNDQLDPVPSRDPGQLGGGEQESISHHVVTESQRWPGTQFLLARAQQDLFASPHKSDSDATLAGSSTSKSFTHGENGVVSSKKHKGLARLSQGHLPSTQALLDGWQGWSTVKKPRGDRESMKSLQSPTIGKGKPGTEVETSRRGSGLRFSLPGPDSPLLPRSDPIRGKEGSSLPRKGASSGTPSESTAHDHSARQSLDRCYDSAGSGSQFQSTSSEGRDPQGDSQGCAQVHPQPRLSLETMELESTIVQLTNDVLGDACTGSF